MRMPDGSKIQALVPGTLIWILIVSACVQTKFESLIDLPSKFDLLDFQYYPSTTLFSISGFFSSYSDNKGVDCAKVEGTVDWGDGIKEYFTEIPPCISVTNTRSWTSSPLLRHTYPAARIYAFGAVLTAHFTNGSVTDKIEKEIIISDQGREVRLSTISSPKSGR